MKWKIINEPFPLNVSLKRTLISALLFGSFVFLFLFVFQPFGLRNYENPNKTIQLLGYGLVTTACLFGSNLFFKYAAPHWFSHKTWTVGKNIAYTLWMFFLIGMGNLSYSAYLNFIELSLKGFVSFQIITVLIGLFPVVISTFIAYNRRLSKALKEAAELNTRIVPSNETAELVDLPSKNKKESLQVPIANLLAIKAVENYVEVYHQLDQKLQKTILRNSLKEIEQSLADYKFILKCHRSFLVNLKEVKNFTGNAQGLSLNFGAFQELQIPVSRSFVAAIKKEFQNRPHA